MVRVSLIRWTGIWNGTVEWNDECAQLQLTRVTGTVDIGRPTYYVPMGLLSHHGGCMSKCCCHTSLSGIMMSQS